jgi:hypothetical protein
VNTVLKRNLLLKFQIWKLIIFWKIL